jgi:predicted AlkP superfamily phosphohydrolase/phosphomutase
MLLILQFDAVHLPSLDRLLAAGRLPTLAALRQRGTWQTLRSPAACLEGAVTQTLHSGQPVTEHGFYYPFQWSPTEQRVHYWHDLPPPEPVWQRLAAAGRRPLVIDPYDGRASAQSHGVCVCGWQFTNRVSLRKWAVPAAAMNELQRHHAAPVAADEVFGEPTAARLLRQREKLLAGPDRVADAVLHFLPQQPFDLVWATFLSSHFAGHQFLDLDRFPGLAAENGTYETLTTTVDDVYVAIDRAMGRILEAAPDDADVIVLSPYGMGEDANRLSLLPAMLQAVLAGGPQPASESAAGTLLWRLRAALPTDLREKIGLLLPDRLALELTARLAMRGTDWATTRAFVLPGDDDGYIRLNIAGRERDGIVAAGDAEALMTEIVEGLATFHDIDGGPAVRNVLRPAAVYGDGPHADLLPDLVVQWREAMAEPFRGVASPRFGSIANPGWHTGRSGVHVDAAWSLLVPGRSTLRTSNRTPAVEDIAATACALSGVGTEGLAGEPLLDPA